MADVEPSATFLYGLMQVKLEVHAMPTSRIYKNGVQQSARCERFSKAIHG
jgi:hypothetical protein